MGIFKDVLVWSAADLSATPTLNSTFTVTGTPDLMAFSDDEGNEAPADFDPIDLNQTLYGTLDGQNFTGNNGTSDVFEFEVAFQVTDGTNTFNVYQIDNGSLGSNTIAYVSEYPLQSGVTYTVTATDISVNFDNGTGYETTPQWSDLAGHVDGTSADETITSGFVDDDGDQIDGLDGPHDIILGEGGGDTILSGAGNDLVYGDHVEELPDGTTEYVVQGFVRDFNFELESGSLRIGGSDITISGEPIEIRIIDNDSGAGDDDVVNDVPTDQDQLIEINGVLYNFSPDFTSTYTGSDGNTYTMMIVDVDRNGGGSIDNYSATGDPGDRDYEHGQILIPVGPVPPAGVWLTATGTGATVSNPDYTTLNGGTEITNYDDSIDAGTGDDTVYGGQGADIVSGGDGTDTLFGGSGNDTLAGGAGNDSIDAGTGSDTILLADGYLGDNISGGEDPDGLDIDTIDASGVTTDGVDVFISSGESGSVTSTEGTANFSDIENYVLTDQADTFNGNFSTSDLTVDGAGGDDVLRGGNATNTLYGGTGNDLFVVGYGVDSIEGGAGVDTLSIDQADDVINLTFDGDGSGLFNDDDGDSGTFIEIEAVEGSSGADTIDATATTQGVSLYGMDGADTLIGGSGNDLLDGGTGADSITGGGGSDTILGGDGNDVIDGGLGADSIDGGTGDDSITGGDGNDTITGGTGNDTLSGGAGDDTFVYNPGDGLDVITDFNSGNTGPINDDIASNNDQIVLTGYYDHLHELWADQADDGILNQSNTTDTQGNAVDYSDNLQFATGDGIIVQGATADRFTFNQDNTGVVCFASGSLIRTPYGAVPIEHLKAGDTVITRDNGPQQILWAGRRALSQTELETSPNLRPVWLSGRFFGLEKDLIVSPQHGVLLRDPDRGGAEILYRATHLADLDGGGARVMKNCKRVTYHHLMFAEHQIISANGMWSESLYPGVFALSALTEAARSEILQLFPDLATGDIETAYGPSAIAYSRRRILPESTRDLTLAG